MDYNKFYKKAEDPTWADTIGSVQGYGNQLPMLALLAGTGALGGYALGKKKRKNALIGGISLPALYLAYVAARRNGVLPNSPESDDILDKGVNYVNDFGNIINPFAKTEA